MDINTLRILATVASLAVFIGIVIWTWKRRKSQAFKDAANLPFDEEKLQQKDRK